MAQGRRQCKEQLKHFFKDVPDPSVRESLKGTIKQWTFWTPKLPMDPTHVQVNLRFSVDDENNKIGSVTNLNSN